MVASMVMVMLMCMAIACVHEGSIAHLLVTLAAGVLVTGLPHVLHQRRLGSSKQASGDGVRRGRRVGDG